MIVLVGLSLWDVQVVQMLYHDELKRKSQGLKVRLKDPLSRERGRFKGAKKS